LGETLVPWLGEAEQQFTKCYDPFAIHLSVVLGVAKVGISFLLAKHRADFLDMCHIATAFPCHVNKPSASDVLLDDG
jgi:hypothetical protein